MPVDYYGHVWGDDLELDFEQPTFTSFVTGSYGDMDTEFGVFDALFGTTNDGLGGILDEITALDDIAGLMDLAGDPTIGLTTPNDTPAFINDLATSDYNLFTIETYAAPFTGQAAPGQPPPPPGAGGGGGQNLYACPVDTYTTLAWSYPIGHNGIVQLQLYSYNTTGGDVKIQNITLSQDTNGYFTLQVPSDPVDISANGTIFATVLAAIPFVGVFYCSVSFTVLENGKDVAGSPEIVCLQVTVTD